MNNNLIFRVAALVLFIFAAVFFFGVGNVSTSAALGLAAAGLAAYVSSDFWPRA